MQSTSASFRAQRVRHKVFLSYYHNDDQQYRDAFESAFGDIYIVKTVQSGDIATDNSDEYIKRLIQEDFISDASVIIVLVGPKTKCRKHVDWEISAGLDRRVGGYSGLMGILLPTFPLTSANEYNRDDLPKRLDANVHSGYAKLYRWNGITSNADSLAAAIDAAFKRRLTDANKIVNGLLQMQRNTCS